MLVHPTPMPFDAIGEGTLAVALFDVHYTGKASHAGVAPEQGINVADAMTIAQVASSFPQQFASAASSPMGARLPISFRAIRLPAITCARQRSTNS